MRRFAPVLLAVLALAPVVGAQSVETKIPVFVKSGGDASGFTDPSKDRQDSTADLKKKVGDSKLIRLVTSEDDATVVLEVLGRETKREANVTAFLSGAKQNRSSLTVRLTAGEFSAEFSGESGSKGVLSGYGDAAGKVVKQVDDWVKANRAQLIALKK